MRDGPTNNGSVPKDGSISVIVVNYNGGNHILDCLRSLESQTYTNCSVTVLDNQSTDRSLEQVRSQFPGMHVIETGYNAGWGVACNVGIEATRSEYIALVNNDAYLHTNCLEEMVRTIELSPEYGACASKLLFWDEPGVMDCAGLVIHRDGSSYGRGRSQPADHFSITEEVFCVNDCCCLYRREMVNDIGLYDPDFFLYCDETDIGWRHQLAGWKCIYTPNAIAYHMHSRGAGSYSDLKSYHVERNRIFICLKYFPVWRLALSFLFSACRYAYQVWGAFRGDGYLAEYREEASLLRGLRVLAEAHVDALRMAPVMLQRRRQYRSIRRLRNKDAEVLFRRYRITLREIASYK